MVLGPLAALVELPGSTPGASPACYIHAALAALLRELGAPPDLACCLLPRAVPASVAAAVLARLLEPTHTRSLVQDATAALAAAAADGGAPDSSSEPLVQLEALVGLACLLSTGSTEAKLQVVWWLLDRGATGSLSLEHVLQGVLPAARLAAAAAQVLLLGERKAASEAADAEAAWHALRTALTHAFHEAAPDGVLLPGRPCMQLLQSTAAQLALAIAAGSTAPPQQRPSAPGSSSPAGGSTRAGTPGHSRNASLLPVLAEPNSSAPQHTHAESLPSSSGSGHVVAAADATGPSDRPGSNAVVATGHAAPHAPPAGAALVPHEQAGGAAGLAALHQQQQQQQQQVCHPAPVQRQATASTDALSLFLSADTTESTAGGSGAGAHHHHGHARGAHAASSLLGQYQQQQTPAAAAGAASLSPFSSAPSMTVGSLDAGQAARAADAQPPGGDSADDAAASGPQQARAAGAIAAATASVMSALQASLAAAGARLLLSCGVCFLLSVVVVLGDAALVVGLHLAGQPLAVAFALAVAANVGLVLGLLVLLVGVRLCSRAREARLRDTANRPGAAAGPNPGDVHDSRRGPEERRRAAARRRGAGGAGGAAAAAGAASGRFSSSQRATSSHWPEAAQRSLSGRGDVEAGRGLGGIGGQGAGGALAAASKLRTVWSTVGRLAGFLPASAAGQQGAEPGSFEAPSGGVALGSVLLGRAAGQQHSSASWGASSEGGGGVVHVPEQPPPVASRLGTGGGLRRTSGNNMPQPL